LLPETSVPPAVNTPSAIMWVLRAVSDVVMIWKCSVPEALRLAAGLATGLAAGLALAGARPDTATVPAATTTLAAAKSLFLYVAMMGSSC
jgi:hypothetical protein